MKVCSMHFLRPCLHHTTRLRPTLSTKLSTPLNLDDLLRIAFSSSASHCLLRRPRIIRNFQTNLPNGSSILDVPCASKLQIQIPSSDAEVRDAETVDSVVKSVSDLTNDTESEKSYDKELPENTSPVQGHRKGADNHHDNTLENVLMKTVSVSTPEQRHLKIRRVKKKPDKRERVRKRKEAEKIAKQEVEKRAIQEAEGKALMPNNAGTSTDIKSSLSEFIEKPDTVETVLSEMFPGSAPKQPLSIIPIKDNPDKMQRIQGRLRESRSVRDRTVGHHEGKALKRSIAGTKKSMDKVLNILTDLFPVPARPKPERKIKRLDIKAFYDNSMFDGYTSIYDNLDPQFDSLRLARNLRVRERALRERERHEMMEKKLAEKEKVLQQQDQGGPFVLMLSNIGSSMAESDIRRLVPPPKTNLEAWQQTLDIIRVIPGRDSWFNRQAHYHLTFSSRLAQGTYRESFLRHYNGRALNIDIPTSFRRNKPIITLPPPPPTEFSSPRAYRIIPQDLGPSWNVATTLPSIPTVRITVAKIKRKHASAFLYTSVLKAGGFDQSVVQEQQMFQVRNEKTRSRYSGFDTCETGWMLMFDRYHVGEAHRLVREWHCRWTKYYPPEGDGAWHWVLVEAELLVS